MLHMCVNWEGEILLCSSVFGEGLILLHMFMD